MKCTGRKTKKCLPPTAAQKNMLSGQPVKQHKPTASARTAFEDRGHYPESKQKQKVSQVDRVLTIEPIRQDSTFAECLLIKERRWSGTREWYSDDRTMRLIVYRKVVVDGLRWGRNDILIRRMSMSNRRKSVFLVSVLLIFQVKEVLAVFTRGSFFWMGMG